MRAVDINVLARFLLNADPDQGARAQALLQTEAYSVTALMEVGRLRTSRYDFSRALVARLISAIFGLPTVQVEQSGGVRRPVGRYSARADMLHLVVASPVRSFAPFASVDRGVASAAGDGAPVAFEALH